MFIFESCISSVLQPYNNPKKAKPMKRREIFTTLVYLFAARAATAAG